VEPKRRRKVPTRRKEMMKEERRTTRMWNVTSYVCGEKGHISKQCPDKIQKQSGNPMTLPHHHPSPTRRESESLRRS
jgi:hypothetical protein